MGANGMDTLFPPVFARKSKHELITYEPTRAFDTRCVAYNDFHGVIDCQGDTPPD